MAKDNDQRIRVMRIIARMNVGGPAVQVSGLMRGLDSNKFEHRLVTGFCAEDESDYLDTVATDVTATRINGLGRSISPKADLFAFLQVVREIRKFRPHIIHTHTAKAGVIGRIASILSGRKSIRVHTYHGHLLHGYFGKGKTFLVIIIEKFLGLFTTKLLAVGKKVMEDLLSAGIGSAEKFALMPPGLKLEALPTREAACLELGLDPSQNYCAFIGRVTKIKRPDRFLDVVAEIQNHNVPIHFIVAGAGDLLEYCKERATAKNLPVTFLGWREDIETVLAASDVVLLTSDNEGTPLSLIQAGMAKIAVVSTDVGSVREIVVDQETGILTDLTTHSIANVLKELILDIDLRDDMGLAAYDYTMQRYGVERLVSDHEKLYLDLINDQANS
ncbi:MAG: glycosyltransferase [Actinobacteria bacterium]|nr:glycosyltransferase [Actinomycetota bacterium]